MFDRLLPDLPRTPRQWLHTAPYLLSIGMNIFPGWAPNRLEDWQLTTLRAGSVVFLLALFMRSRRPGLVALLGILLSYVGGDVILGAAMFTIGLYRRGRIAVMWCLAAFVMICMPGVPLISLTMKSEGISEFTMLLIRGIGATAFMIILPATWGGFINQHDQLIESLHMRALEAEEHQELLAVQASQDERARIAGEMHDILGHKLSLITMQAGALEMSAGRASAEKTAALAVQLRETSRGALQDLRDILAVLGTEATGTAPQPDLGDLVSLVENNRRAGAKITWVDELGVASGSVPQAVGRTAYRVVQEALTNAHKHSPGAHVEVTVSGQPGGSLVVKVFNYRLPHAPAGIGNGSGLTRLSERVRLAGGAFETQATSDGWLVTATLPWKQEEKK